MFKATKISQIKEKVVQAIELAITDAGKTKNDIPEVILIAPTKLKEEPIVETIEFMFGKRIRIMGGTPGSPIVFTGDTIVNHGFALAAIYPDSKIGVGFHSGVKVNKKMSGTVTALGANNRILKEINGRPAFDVYNEWANGLFANIEVDKLKKPLPIWKQAGRTTLVKLYEIGEGKYGTNVTNPIALNPDKSLTIGTDLYVGDIVYYSLASKRSYIKRAGIIVNGALINGKIKKNELAGGIHAYCRGAAFGQLGKNVESLQVIVDETRQAMEGKPFIGGFTAG